MTTTYNIFSSFEDVNSFLIFYSELLFTPLIILFPKISTQDNIISPPPPSPFIYFTGFSRRRTLFDLCEYFTIYPLVHLPLVYFRPPVSLKWQKLIFTKCAPYQVYSYLLFIRTQEQIPIN